jgi:hypothetical protein
MSGTPEYIANLLTAYQDVGVDRFALWMPGPDVTDSMQRFVDQVRPAAGLARPRPRAIAHRRGELRGGLAQPFPRSSRGPHVRGSQL